MLKILKDVTILHNGKEIRAKAGQIVNVKASFDVNDEKAKGIEIRYADKFRNFVKLVNVERGSGVETETLDPIMAHNDVEQEIRRKEKEAVCPVQDNSTEENEEENDEPSVDKEQSKRGRPKKK